MYSQNIIETVFQNNLIQKIMITIKFASVQHLMATKSSREYIYSFLASHVLHLIGNGFFRCCTALIYRCFCLFEVMRCGDESIAMKSPTRQKRPTASHICLQFGACLVFSSSYFFRPLFL